MSQSDRNPQKENKSRGSEPNFNWRGVILIAIAFGFIALAMLFYRGGMQPVEDVPYNRFLDLLENKQIVTDKNYPLKLVVEDGRPTQTLRGSYSKQGVGAAPAQQIPFRTTIYLNYNTNLQERLAAAGIQPANAPAPSPPQELYLFPLRDSPGPSAAPLPRKPRVRSAPDQARGSGQ